MNSILIVAGPTAVGKKAFVHKLSEEIKIECIWADSRKVYKYMDIGTAKPKGDHILHHMLDLIEPSQRFSVAEFVKEARECIEKIWKKGALPVVVGGTGLYIKGLVDGIFEGVGAVPSLREKLLKEEEKQRGYLYSILCKVDEEAARRIARTDIFRIVRALEVYYTMGHPISWLQKHCTKAFECNKLMLLLKETPDTLYKKIEERTHKMIEEGLLNETLSILSAGYTKDAPGLQTIGYKEMILYIEGKCSWDEAILLIKKRTKELARKQMMWFKKDKRFHTYSPEEFKHISSLIKDFLQKNA